MSTIVYQIQIQFSAPENSTGKWYSQGQLFIVTDGGINADGFPVYVTTSNQGNGMYVFKADCVVIQQTTIPTEPIPLPVFGEGNGFFQQQYTVYTQGSQIRNPDHTTSPGLEVPSTIFANIQPATQHQIQNLPEGRRKSKTYSVQTKTKLQTVSISNGLGPCQIQIGPDRYTVEAEEPYHNFFLNHYTYLVCRRGNE